MSSDFIALAIDSLDVSTITSEVIEGQMEQQIPLELSWFKDYPDQNMKKLLIELEPSIKEQIKKAADPIADYLVGNDRSFTVVIQTKPIVETLKTDLLQYVLTSPSPELAELSHSAIEANFDTLFNQIAPEIRASFVVNKSTIGTDVPAQIANSINEAEKGLT
ncbi:hypothetical protein ACFLTP_09160 [Chloroflexota bacterium]